MPIIIIFTAIISTVLMLSALQGIAHYQAHTEYQHRHRRIIDNTHRFIGHHCHTTAATVTRFRYDPNDCPNNDNMACSPLTETVKLDNAILTLEFEDGKSPYLQIQTTNNNAHRMANYFISTHHWQDTATNTIIQPIDKVLPIIEGPGDLMMTASGIDRNCGRTTRQNATDEYNADLIEWPPPGLGLAAKTDNNLDTCDPMTTRPCFAASLNETLRDKPADIRQHCYDIALPAICN